jgi:hypothetical protein
MAEGVVSEPFLPSGDQGRKGGFAPFMQVAVGETVVHWYDAKRSRKEARRQRENAQKLGTQPQQARQVSLASNPPILGRRMIGFRTLTMQPRTALWGACD